MKTPIQELIDELDKRYIAADSDDRGQIECLLSIMGLLSTEFIEKEKQVIIEAYSTGQVNRTNSKVQPEQYYTDKFKT